MIQKTQPAVGTATERWLAAVQALEAKDIPRAKALSRANAENPGLREAMLGESGIGIPRG